LKISLFVAPAAANKPTAKVPFYIVMHLL